MLTEREKEILEAIKDYIDKNGFSPSIRDICDIAGLKSKSTVHGYLKSLENKGYIQRLENFPRALTIAKENDGLKNINITVTEEDFKTIVATIIARQESLKFRMQKYGHDSTDINELDDLDALFNKLLVYVDEVS